MQGIPLPRGWQRWMGRMLERYQCEFSWLFNRTGLVWRQRKLLSLVFFSLIPLMVFITLSPFWWVGSCWVNMFWLENEFFLLRLPNPFLWICSQMLLLPILKCHSVAEAPLQNTKGNYGFHGMTTGRGEGGDCFNTVSSTDLGFFNGRFLIRDCAQWKFDHFFQTYNQHPYPRVW